MFRFRGSLLRGSIFFFVSDGTGTCIGCASCSFLVLSAVIGTVGISLSGFPNTKLFSWEGELSGEDGVSWITSAASGDEWPSGDAGVSGI